MGPALLKALPDKMLLTVPVGLGMVLIHRRRRQEWLGLSSPMGLFKMCFKASNSGQIFVGTHCIFLKNSV